jgi:cell division protein FtsX
MGLRPKPRLLARGAPSPRSPRRSRAVRGLCTGCECAAIDPTLQLRELAAMDEVLRKDQAMLRLVAVALAVLTLSVVLLSAAGIYALMSFTVTRRRKEIGIRAALGADPRRILASIFSRALGQLAVGAAVGVIVAVGLEALTRGDLMRLRNLVLVQRSRTTGAPIDIIVVWSPFSTRSSA